MWYLPGDMASNARIITGFFDENEEAEARDIAKCCEYPPEMALFYEVQSHDKSLRRSVKLWTAEIASLEEFDNSEACFTEERQMLRLLKEQRQKAIDELEAFSTLEEEV
jgi:predicted DNA-binding WGR domain protein